MNRKANVMYGHLVNNTALIDLVTRNVIEISPFDARKARTIHYQLTADSVLWNEGLDSDGHTIYSPRHSFQVLQRPYRFAPNEYALVSVQEFVAVPEGVVGHFVPSSNLIDFGFLLNAGRVEYPFGTGEYSTAKLRFGIKNLRETENLFDPTLGFVWMYFFDLRGLDNVKLDLTEHDYLRLAQKLAKYMRAADDGPAYLDR